MKNISSIAFNCIATFIAICTATAISTQDLSLIPFINIIPLASGAIVLLIFPILMTIPLSSLQHAEQGSSPGVLRIMLSNNTLATTSIIIATFPIISIATLINKQMFPYWIILSGITIDCIRYQCIYITRLLAPKEFIALLSKSIMKHTYNDNIENLLTHLEELFSLAQNAVRQGNISSATHTIKTATSLTADILELSINPIRQELHINVNNILSLACENFEAINNISIKKGLTIPCETVLNSLQTIVLETALDAPSYSSTPIGCLHKCSEQLYKSNSDMMLIGISCVTLSEGAMKILDHVNYNDKTIANFYSEIIRFFEYFAKTNPTPQEETISKIIVGVAVGQLTQKLCKIPYNVSPVLHKTLIEIKTILDNHRKSKYAQLDKPFHEKLLSLIVDIDIVTMPKE